MSPLNLAERRALVVKLHAAGLPAETIAGVLGVSPDTVRRDLRAEGLKPHPQGRPRRAGPAGGAPAPATSDEARLEQMRRLYETQRQQIDERLAQGENVTGEIQTLMQIELRLRHFEDFLRLRELTRKPKGT